ncbi:MAG TPA: lipopolysaccharide kinase InaA family protein [Planctomycetota bacterium]|nr:lipopolysaccharide kinase InaA family protein [Planctomycetota bacterium]
MARPESARIPGRLEVVARTVEEARAAGAFAVEAAARAPRHAAFVDLLGTPAYFKQSALTGKTAVRYALRRGVLRAKLPRLREYENLRWLLDHGFHAPEPLAAGASWRGGLPRFQFLFTRAVPGARTLGVFLAEERDARSRSRVLALLARETARMHALGFVHHDLFPRNVLVTGYQSPRVWFLDCWAGGPPRQVRTPAYDLACLTRPGRDALAPDDADAFLLAYRAAAPA